MNSFISLLRCCINFGSTPFISALCIIRAKAQKWGHRWKYTKMIDDDNNSRNLNLLYRKLDLFYYKKNVLWHIFSILYVR
jgi:hypothetical protein